MGQKKRIEVRLKSGKYSSTNKPLGERVLHNIDLQIQNPGVSTNFFHGNKVIGLQYKYTTKRVSSKVQKVEETVQFLP